MSMRMRGYLFSYAVTLVVLAFALVLFTIVVDPYRMYGTPPLPGITELKPRVYERAALAKARQLERAAAETIVLGNSRAEIGFDPDSPHWPDDARPVFNAALAGRGLFMSVRMLQHAIAVHRPEMVVIGLDFPDFLVAPSDGPPPVVGADERRLLVDRNGRPNPERAQQRWRDRFNTTLTIDAITDSFATIIGQHSATAVTMTPAGFNPLNNYRLEVERNGHSRLFSQKNRTYARQYANSSRPDFTDLDHNAAFRALKSLLRITAEHDIRTILFIHPYHAQYLEILNEAGFWDSFEAWKRSIVHLLAAETATRSVPVKLIDFSGYSRFTTEPVPPPGDTQTEMRWYWESGHYKSALGDRMLARIFGSETGFGKVLNETNIEQALLEIRRRRAAFLGKQSITGLIN